MATFTKLQPIQLALPKLGKRLPFDNTEGTTLTSTTVETAIKELESLTVGAVLSPEVYTQDTEPVVSQVGFFIWEKTNGGTVVENRYMIFSDGTQNYGVEIG